MKERRERKQAHRLMLHDNPKAFNRRKVRGSLSTFLEEGMAMKHLVGEVHQPRDHLNVCHPKAGYTYSRMTKDVSAHRRRREPARRLRSAGARSGEGLQIQGDGL